MGEPAGIHRVRPAQVVLGVGGVLVVSAGAAVTAAYGGTPARLFLMVLAAAAAALSLRATWGGLRSSAETFAACSVGLSIVGSDVGGVGGSTTLPLGFAAGFLVLHRIAPATVTWPLASWLAAQVAALRVLDSIPDALLTGLFLGMALVGLGVALWGRPLVARAALLTSVPWWVAGVGTGLWTAWTGPGAQRWICALLLVGAGAGLLAARLRRTLDPLLGPPRAAPVLAGLVTGAGLMGAFAVLGTAGTTLAGYVGVLAASTAASALDGWRRGLFLPVSLAAGGVLVLLSVGRLVTGTHWAALSLLLFLTAAPSVLVAFRRAEDRSVAAPSALACLTGSVLLALAAGFMTQTGAAVILTFLYAAASLIGPDLAPDVRRPTERTAAVAAVAAIVLLALTGNRAALALDLVVQGVCTIGWAWRTWVPDSPPPPADADADADDRRPRVPAAWRLGAAQLVVAAWIVVTLADVHVLEAYTLPLAAGLLLAAGPRLTSGPSWPTWGPALLIAAVPSGVLAVVEPGSTRPVAVLLLAAAAMLAGARSGLRAPLMVGAWTAVGVAIGLSAQALPWPVAAALAVGVALLAVGARREQAPVAGFGGRLADLR